MVLERPGEPLARRAARSAAGPGQVLISVGACGVCRTDLHIVDGELDRAEAAARARPPDRRRVVEAGEGAERFAAASGSACPGWAGPAASAATAVERPREPLRPRPLHRLRPRRRLRRAGRRRRALLLPAPRGLPGRAGGAAALRRADRLPGAAAGAATPSGSASTASAPPRTSSARSPSHQGRRVFAFTRAGDDGGAGASRASSAPSGRALRARRRPRSSTRAIIFAPVGDAGAGALCGAAPRADGRLRRHPHERHPVASPTRCSGASARCGSVANLTRRDGEEFLALAPEVPVRTEVELHPTRRSANEALDSIRDGSLGPPCAAV